jgi:hypothetical protein
MDRHNENKMSLYLSIGSYSVKYSTSSVPKVKCSLPCHYYGTSANMMKYCSRTHVTCSVTNIPCQLLYK